METLNNQSTRAEIFDAHVRSHARAPFLPALAACTLAILGGIDASESELRQTAALSAEIPAEGRYGFSKELIESDVRALALQMQVAYQGLPPANTHSAAVEAPPAKALLVVRTSIPGLDVRKLNQLAEQVAASINRTDFKLVTLSDANVTSAEAKSGSAAQGGLLDFNENQSVAHAAAARGLGLVLFVDLMHFNAKASTIPGAAKIHILNARASLTLLNAEDGVRVAGASRKSQRAGRILRICGTKGLSCWPGIWPRKCTSGRFPQPNQNWSSWRCMRKWTGLFSRSWMFPPRMETSR